MTLQEFINSYDKPYPIAITILNNFCFIGTVEDYHKTIMAINKYFRTRRTISEEPYKDLWDRKITNEFLTDVYQNYVVQLEGEEGCKYWFRHEFEEDYGHLLERKPNE